MYATHERVCLSVSTSLAPTLICVRLSAVEHFTIYSNKCFSIENWIKGVKFLFPSLRTAYSSTYVYAVHTVWRTANVQQFKYIKKVTHRLCARSRAASTAYTLVCLLAISFSLNFPLKRQRKENREKEKWKQTVELLRCVACEANEMCARLNACMSFASMDIVILVEKMNCTRRFRNIHNYL